MIIRVPSNPNHSFSTKGKLCSTVEGLCQRLDWANSTSHQAKISAYLHFLNLFRVKPGQWHIIVMLKVQKKIDTKPGTNSRVWLISLGVPITFLCWAPLVPWGAVMSQNSVGREPMAPLQKGATAKGACSLGWAGGREGKIFYKCLLSLWSFWVVFYLFSQYTDQ